MSWYAKLVTGLAVKEKCSVNCKVPEPTGTITPYGNYGIQNCLFVGTIAEKEELSGEWTLTGTKDPGGDAFLLPWEHNRIVWGKLEGTSTKFLTYKVNGCGVIISGSRESPVVVHANEDGANLSAIVASNGVQAAAAKCNIYRDVITHLQQTIPGFEGDVATWYPGENYSTGGVFGVKASGVWKIYGHSSFGKNSTTVQIWPVDAVLDGDNTNPCKCCYITTAVCGAMGLADDCDELQTLRWFRDEVMNATEAGQRDVATYYATAPHIVAEIDRQADAVEWYRRLYTQTIEPAVAAVHRGDIEQAYVLYRRMVLDLQERTQHDPC